MRVRLCLCVTFMLDVMISFNLLLISNDKGVHMYTSKAYRRLARLMLRLDTSYGGQLHVPAALLPAQRTPGTH
jgi:hypothetical protein